MSLQWNKVTRFSQVVAIVLFVAVFYVGFYLGGHVRMEKIFGAVLNDVVFMCDGGKSIHATFYAQGVHIAPAGAEDQFLLQTISASGARYATADEQLVFWNKGDIAFIERNGKIDEGLSSCVLNGSKGETPTTSNSDYKNATYTIDGTSVQLVNGVAETPAAPGSAAMVTTRYFGNELVTDLDGDGRDDIAFILTQSGGGSGTFYYAVAARNTEQGFVGSDGYLLGDRIAPQSTTLSTQSKHSRVVVFNVADRATGESMTAKPTVGKSIYLKLDPATMQWGIVEPDFEGETR